MGLRKHEGQGCILADEMYVSLFRWAPALLIHCITRGLGKTLQVYKSRASFLIIIYQTILGRLYALFGPSSVSSASDFFEIVFSYTSQNKILTLVEDL